MELISHLIEGFVSHLSHSESLFKVLLLLLATVWVSGSIFAHMGLPRILGEIFAVIFFGPVFFAYVGMTISFELFWENTFLLLALFCIVFFAQSIGSAAAAFFISKYSFSDAAQTGVGMLGRGGIEIIVAGIGFTAGLLPLELFSALVAIVFLSTFLPPLLLIILQRREAKELEKIES